MLPPELKEIMALGLHVPTAEVGACRQFANADFKISLTAGLMCNPRGGSSAAVRVDADFVGTYLVDMEGLKFRKGSLDALKALMHSHPDMGRHFQIEWPTSQSKKRRRAAAGAAEASDATASGWSETPSESGMDGEENEAGEESAYLGKPMRSSSGGCMAGAAAPAAAAGAAAAVAAAQAGAGAAAEPGPALARTEPGAAAEQRPAGAAAAAAEATTHLWGAAPGAAPEPVPATAAAATAGGGEPAELTWPDPTRRHVMKASKYRAGGRLLGCVHAGSEWYACFSCGMGEFGCEGRGIILRRSGAGELEVLFKFACSHSPDAQPHGQLRGAPRQDALARAGSSSAAAAHARDSMQRSTEEKLSDDTSRSGGTNQVRVQGYVSHAVG